LQHPVISPAGTRRNWPGAANFTGARQVRVRATVWIRRPSGVAHPRWSPPNGPPV